MAQIPVNTSLVDSLEWRTRLCGLQLGNCTKYLHPNNYNIITRFRTVERSVIGLLKEERRTTSRNRSVRYIESMMLSKTLLPSERK